MEFLVIVVLIGLLPAAIASGKGRSFFAWWIYGALLFIVALPHALIIRPNVRVIERRQKVDGDLKNCPHCDELIKRKARLCRYCQQPVETAA